MPRLLCFFFRKLRTRARVWSDGNPYFFKGKLEGIGGPHVGLGHAWPMSLIMKYLLLKIYLHSKTKFFKIKAFYLNCPYHSQYS